MALGNNDNYLILRFTELQEQISQLKDENQLVRQESDRHYQLWVDSQALYDKAVHQYNGVVDAQLKTIVERTDEIGRLKAEVERLDDLCKKLMKQHSDISCENIMLRKAVMHSPAAQLKLKKLEGKTTYEEINPKEGNQS